MSDDPPIHPGVTLRDEVLAALNLSTQVAARRMGVSRAQMSRLVAGTSGISAEMALRIGKLTGTAPVAWMKMQNEFDLYHAALKVDVSGIETAGVA